MSGQDQERETFGRPRGEDPDQILARALEEYLDRQARGEAVHTEQFRREHPDLALQLDEMLAAAGEVRSIVHQESAAQRFGDYRLLREIGRGGMGVVHEAWEVSLDRRVALKMLPASLLAEPKAIARFEREARVAARLHHPNIVEIFRMGIEGGVPYYVMEFVEGRTLRELQTTRKLPSCAVKGAILEEEGPRPMIDTLSRLLTLTPGTRGSVLAASERDSAEGQVPIDVAIGYAGLSERETWKPADETETSPNGLLRDTAEEDMESDYLDFRKVAEAFAGVADGLHQAHSLGVVHRDLKPSNLMLDCVGNLRILDFGLAWMEGQQRLTHSRESIGTPLYMSPEQADPGSFPLGRGTDIYSLGATLYEVIGGRPPFHGRTIPNTLQQIITTDATPLGRVNPATPRDLETIVHKCLRKSSRERYSTAEALSQDLRRFSRGEPVEARLYSRWERLVRRAWRSRARLAAASCLLILLSVVALLGFRYHAQNRVVRRSAYTNLVTRAVTKLQRGYLEREPGPLRSSAGVYSAGVFLPQGMIFTEAADFRAALCRTASRLVEEALAELDVAIEEEPYRPDAYYHKARCFLILERGDDALEALDAALRCAPDFVPARILRGTVFEQSGDRKSAAEELELAARETRHGWAAAWLEAHRAKLAGNVLQAEVAFTRLLELQEQGSISHVGALLEILLSRGTARLEHGDLEGAIRDFARAQGRWPRQLEPALLLGKAYLLGEHDEEAAKVFADLPARLGMVDEVCLSIAETYCSVGRNAAGLEWIERLRNEHLRERSRAPVHIWLGELEQAKAAALRAVELEPQDPLSNLWLGLALYMEQGATEEATSSLRQAVQLDPDNAMAHVWLGDALARRGELDAALENYRRATRLDPGNAWSHISQGVTLERMGKLEDAFALYVTAFEVDPDLPAAYHHLDGLFRRPEKPELGRHLDRFTRVVEEVVAGSGDHPLLPDVLRILSRALCERQEPGDVERALHYARLAVEKTHASLPRMLATLAAAQAAGGAPADAVVTLERVVSLPHASHFHADQLDGLRAELLPDLVSFESVDAALAARDVEVIIPQGAEWKFFRGTVAPAGGTLAWTEPGFDDSSWESGATGIGFADGDDRTILSDMRGSYTTVYLRQSFTVDDLSSENPITLSVVADDGFVAYLNGLEVLRTRVRPSRGPLPHDAVADIIVSVEPPRPSERVLDPALLREGVNLLALQGLNAGLNSSDFSLIPVLKRRRPPARDTDRVLVEGLRTADGAARPLMLAYLEGRVLQRAGDLESAAEKLLDVSEADPDSLQPVLRLAECYRAAGSPREAAAVLHERLWGPLSAEPKAWRAWGKLCFVDLELQPLSVLPELPRPFGTSASEAAIRIAQDYRWLLERLHMGEALRLNCGGDDYRDSEGHSWSHDRFYRGGCRYGETGWSPLPAGEYPLAEVEIASTEDDRLYQTERWFPSDEIAPAGYSLPLPPGSYRVKLHFAEIFAARPGTRVFHVSLEGRRVLEWYEPLAAGFATADAQEALVEVSDGLLDIVLVPEAEFPKISAIEVEPAP